MNVHGERLFRETSRLLDEAVARVADEHRATLVAARERLEAPLRVAIAGQVKAGKSTLLNALVGEHLAATDARECTTIVTWYREGVTRHVTAVPRTGGTPSELRFERTDTGIDIDLGGRHADDIEWLEVTWPSSVLGTMTLIDTPGIGSANETVSERAHRFLTASDDDPSEADAVVYLMRHVHAADVDFLEAFRDTRVARATAVNTLAVLARADEIGVGRLDAMEAATRIADRYAADPRLRRLVTTTVPVAALIAQAGAAMNEETYRRLVSVAELADEPRELALLSADRFLGADVLTDTERRDLMGRLGLFGLRIAIDRIRAGTTPTATALAHHLVELSGLERLRTEIVRFFGHRAQILKARSALLALEQVADATRGDGDSWLDGELERIMASAHEFTELRLMAALRAGSVPVPPDEARRMERLLGFRGGADVERLGLDVDAASSDIRNAASSELAAWQRRAANPMSAQEVSDAAQVLIRTCESMLAARSGSP